MNITDIKSLTSHLADTLGLEDDARLEAAARDAMRGRGRYESLDADALESLERDVWYAVTDGDEWPFG